MRIMTVARGIFGLGLIVLAASQVALAQAGATVKKEVQRGKYLVGYGGCHDCHPPKLMTPNRPAPDESHLLSGHPANPQLPPLPPTVIGPRPHNRGPITKSDLADRAVPWGNTC